MQAQAGRQAKTDRRGRQAGRHALGQTDRPAGRQTCRHRQTGRQAGRHAGTDRQA